MVNPASTVAGVLSVRPGTMVAAFIGLVLILVAFAFAWQFAGWATGQLRGVGRQLQSAIPAGSNVDDGGFP